VAPLLLTIASARATGRREPHYAHIAGRLEASSQILADAKAPGRRYVLHATDETVTEFAVEPYAADAALHVIAMRTPQGQVRHLLELARRRDRASVTGPGNRAV